MQNSFFRLLPFIMQRAPLVRGIDGNPEGSRFISDSGKDYLQSEFLASAQQL